MNILEQAHDTLLLGGIEIIETREIPHGWQLRGANGEVVNVYSTGKAVAQGRNAAAVKALLDARPLPKRPGVVEPKAVAPVEKPAAEMVEEPCVPRFPPDWSWEPWDGVTAPF